jgi:DNA-binding GntR family transcriptional regulator
MQVIEEGSMSENADGSETLGEIFASLRQEDLSSDAVFAALRSAIIGRRMPPGLRFTEDDLAKTFGVSRTPIREAMLRLQAESLVDRLGRKGLMVSRISPAEVVEIYDVRRGLDGLACELAAANAAPPDVAQLRWANDQMRAAGERGDIHALASLNFEFHEWMARASGNTYLLQKVREVQDRVRRFESSTLEYPERWRDAVREHDEIIAAIEARDSSGAKRAAEVHMANSRAVRLAMMSSVPPHT